MKIISRAEAKALGQLRYFTGKPCKHGHISERGTTGGCCIECATIARERPENREKVNARSRKKYAENSEARAERLAYGKAYREANREKFTQWMAEWRAKNPEQARLHRRIAESKRRARKAGVSDGDDAIRAWVQSAKKICYWCNTKCADEYHVDHYQPLSKGGEHRISNLVIACPTCNLRKNAKDPLEFAASVGRLF